MDTEGLIWMFLGTAFILCAISLSLVKIDKDDLKESIHRNPGMALFRFGAYRWGAVFILSIIGMAFLSIGLGWLS